MGNLVASVCRGGFHPGEKIHSFANHLFILVCSLCYDVGGDRQSGRFCHMVFWCYAIPLSIFESFVATVIVKAIKAK